MLHHAMVCQRGGLARRLGHSCRAGIQRPRHLRQGTGEGQATVGEQDIHVCTNILQRGIIARLPCVVSQLQARRTCCMRAAAAGASVLSSP